MSLSAADQFNFFKCRKISKYEIMWRFYCLGTYYSPWDPAFSSCHTDLLFPETPSLLHLLLPLLLSCLNPLLEYQLYHFLAVWISKSSLTFLCPIFQIWSKGNIYRWGFPDGSAGKESTCQCRRCRKHGFDPLVGKEMVTRSNILAWRIPWIEEPGGLYTSWGHKELDMTYGLRTTTNPCSMYVCVCV